MDLHLDIDLQEASLAMLVKQDRMLTVGEILTDRRGTASPNE